MAAYPTSIVSLTNPTAEDTLDSESVPHDEQHANANDEIEAIEAELGTNPSGAYSTVKARLDAYDNAFTAASFGSGLFASTSNPALKVESTGTGSANNNAFMVYTENGNGKKLVFAVDNVVQSSGSPNVGIHFRYANVEIGSETTNASSATTQLRMLRPSDDGTDWLTVYEAGARTHGLFSVGSTGTLKSRTTASDVFTFIKKSETQPRFKIDDAGKLYFGIGGSTEPTLTLAYDQPGILQVTGRLTQTGTTTNDQDLATKLYVDSLVLDQSNLESVSIGTTDGFTGTNAKKFIVLDTGSTTNGSDADTVLVRSERTVSTATGSEVSTLSVYSAPAVNANADYVAGLQITGAPTGGAVAATSAAIRSTWTAQSGVTTPVQMGFFNRVAVPAGTVTKGVGMQVEVEKSSSGVITNAIGISIPDGKIVGTNTWNFQMGSAQSQHMGSIAIGGSTESTTPATSASLDLQSTSKSLLANRLTTTQRNALTAVNGMLHYNSTLGEFESYANGAWEPVGARNTIPTSELGNVSGTLTLDCTKRFFTTTINGNVTTVTLTNLPTSNAARLTVVLKQDATGGRTIAWPSTWVWTTNAGAAPLEPLANVSTTLELLVTASAVYAWLGDRVETYKTHWSDPSIFETTSRLATNANDIGPNSGVTTFHYFTATRTKEVSKIYYAISKWTNGSTPVHTGVYFQILEVAADGSLSRVAVTGNVTSTFSNQTGLLDFTLTTNPTLKAGQRYAVGLTIYGTTMGQPTVRSVGPGIADFLNSNWGHVRIAAKANASGGSAAAGPPSSWANNGDLVDNTNLAWVAVK